MTGVDDLVTWVRAQLDDEERVALGAHANTWTAENAGRSNTEFVIVPDYTASGVGVAFGAANAEHIARWHPARVLAEVDAKRRILDYGGPVCTCASYDSPPMDPKTNWTTPLPHHFDCDSYETAKLLALPYADRPGYREEWRP